MFFFGVVGNWFGGTPGKTPRKLPAWWLMVLVTVVSSPGLPGYDMIPF